jgi:hypothetical protein
LVDGGRGGSELERSLAQRERLYEHRAITDVIARGRDGPGRAAPGPLPLGELLAAQRRKLAVSTRSDQLERHRRKARTLLLA